MMNSEENIIVPDKYRVFLHLEPPTIQWRFGKPPTFETVNNLFEEGRTKVWPTGSLEETVQNIMKSSQMEFAHKIRMEDFKAINPQKFNLFVNGREGLSGEEIVRIGAINAVMKSSLPEEFQYFKTEEETFESSRKDFKSCFPRGFAWEVIEVYSPPPLIAYKFRHWGFFEGPYKGHSPTGELVQFFGLGTLKVDSSMKLEEVQLYYDPVELFGPLLKGNKDLADSVGCPLFSKLST